MIDDPNSLIVRFIFQADAMDCEINAVSAIVDSGADFQCFVRFLLNCYACP
jgi:hypothetical protein